MRDIIARGSPKKTAALVASIQGQPEFPTDTIFTLRIESTTQGKAYSTALLLNGVEVENVSKIAFSHIGGEEPMMEITYDTLDEYLY